ncbi:MAG: hypothetical protein OXC91_03120 [Rhodobacteraceae bacterium]|nr:hypothetical protein [Paracoccaceae bacterium]
MGYTIATISLPAHFSVLTLNGRMKAFRNSSVMPGISISSSSSALLIPVIPDGDGVGFVNGVGVGGRDMIESG